MRTHPGPDVAALVAAVLRDEVRLRGVDPAQIDPEVRVLSREAGRTHILVRHGASATAYSNRFRMTITTTDAREIAQKASGRLDEICRLLARDKALVPYRRNGDHDDVPAWSYVTHRVVLSMITAAGIDPARAARPSTLQSDSARWAREIPSALDGASLRSMPICNAGLKAGRLTVDSISQHATTGGIPFTIFQITAKDHAATLNCTREIPEAMRQGMRGRPLRDLLDHPSLALARDCTVREVRPADFGFEAILDPDDVPLAPAPEGVDTTWLKTTKPIRKGEDA